MISIAFAQAGPSASGGALLQLLPFIVIIFVFYFLMLRPQHKKMKQHQELIKNLKKGDTVVTSGGIHGEIYGLTDTIVTLEIENGVKLKIDRVQIARVEKGTS